MTTRPSPGRVSSLRYALLTPCKLQVEGVLNCFFAFVDTEDGTIMPDFGLVSVARGKQGHNPYATITETRTVILEQKERIKFLIRALNNIYLHPSTTAAASDFVLSVLLANGGDGDDEDDGVNGCLHSMSIARFKQGHHDDDDNDDDDKRQQQGLGEMGDHRDASLLGSQTVRHRACSASSAVDN